jgi:hypothetical protein
MTGRALPIARATSPSQTDSRSSIQPPVGSSVMARARHLSRRGEFVLYVCRFGLCSRWRFLAWRMRLCVPVSVSVSVCVFLHVPARMFSLNALIGSCMCVRRHYSCLSEVLFMSDTVIQQNVLHHRCSLLVDPRNQLAPTESPL